MNSTSRPPTWKVLLAFGIIYFVWGSTFLAIRIGVHEVPPLLLAGMRFFVAGIVLYGWMRLRGEPSPTPRQWGAATILASLIFLVDYGCLFWAEQRIPSGIAAVMLATIPAFMTISEILILRTQRLTLRLAVALLVGLGGVAVLMSHSLSFGETPLDTGGACALIVAAVSWSVAAALTRRLTLPSAKAMSSAAQMLTGGVLLLLSAALFGEFRGFRLEAVSPQCVVRFGVSDRCRINHRLHGVCVADLSRVTDKSGDLCLCESRRCGAGWLLSGRRGAGPANNHGNVAGAGQRGCDYDHASKKPVALR